MTTTTPERVPRGPIDCETAVRRLWDYLDDRLPAMPREEVEAHLAACALCPPHFAFARAMRRALAASAPGSNDDDAAVRARVREILGRRAMLPSDTLQGVHMETLAILVVLEAKPGKEQEVADFLKSALPLARAERGTVSWYAVRLGPSRFGIFDTFADQSGRDAHLSGDIAKALFARAEELLASPPAIERAEILAAKGAAS